MANADRIYVDPSALRSVYLHDERSARLCAWRARTGGALPITRFGRAEIVNSLHLAVHRKILRRPEAAGAVADLEADIREGRLLLVDALWRRTLDLSVELSALHSADLGTRTLDVLHVASAVLLTATVFVTYDKRQSALARVAGLRIVAP